MTALALLGFCLNLGASEAAAARRVSVVVEAGERLGAEAARALVAVPLAGSRVAVTAFERRDLFDPIRRGELLARLSRSDLVVTVGDSATQLVLGELENVPTFFVGASVISGERLAEAGTGGVLAYGLDGLVDAAAALWPRRLGVVFTPGYRALAEQIRLKARGRGLGVETRRISASREIPEALNSLMDAAQAVWLLGDPLLCSGAGFEHAVEQSLARRVPLIAPSPRHVQDGAFLSIEPPVAELLATAAAAIERLAAGPTLALVDQVSPAPAGGRIVVNDALSARWGMRPPADSRWRLQR